MNTLDNTTRLRPVNSDSNPHEEPEEKRDPFEAGQHVYSRKKKGPSKALVLSIAVALVAGGGYVGYQYLGGSE